jgi:hypothetical protein
MTALQFDQADVGALFMLAEGAALLLGAPQRAALSWFLARKRSDGADDRPEQEQSAENELGCELENRGHRFVRYADAQTRHAHRCRRPPPPARNANIIYSIGRVAAIRVSPVSR